MTRTTIRRGAASAGLATVLGLAALAPASAQDVAVPEIPDTPDAMEFLYAPATFYAPFFVAEDKGYFDDYGVDVTLAEKSGRPRRSQLLATGQSQSGGETWGSGLFNSIAQGATDLDRLAARQGPRGPRRRRRSRRSSCPRPASTPAS